MQAPPPVPDLLALLTAFIEKVQVAIPDGVDWGRHPAAGQWSLTEVVCHLRDVEREVHLARFRALLAADNAFMPGVTADEWSETRHYQQQDGPAALADFLASRQESVDLLTQAPADFWERRGRHSFFGPTSAHELLALVVQHDQAHLEQIQALVKRFTLASG